MSSLLGQVVPDRVVAHARTRRTLARDATTFTRRFRGHEIMILRFVVDRTVPSSHQADTLQGLAINSPWSIAKTASGVAAHDRHASAISASSAWSETPYSIA